jgi:flagellar hook assembly protein FlgD
VQIYDAEGRVARTLADNRSTTTELDLIWDGQTDAGKKANTGGYLALCSYYGQGGKTKKIKLALAVAP